MPEEEGAGAPVFPGGGAGADAGGAGELPLG